MSKKLKYVNRKGDIYYFREVSGKRGTRIACSKKESENDLATLPDAYEIVEAPNGQVWYRKKIEYDLLPEEIKLAEELCPKLVKKNARVVVEAKKKMLVIHSANTDSMNDLWEFMGGFGPGSQRGAMFLEKSLHYEAVLRLELSNKEKRTFSVFRKCWVGSYPEWICLADGPLKKMLKKYVPHIEQESFFELF